MKSLPVTLSGLALAALAVAGCNSSSHSGQAGAAASSAEGAVASVTADPIVAAELAQAELLVKSCFPAAPLDQVHVVHLVFLSSAAGKNGPAVTAARTKLLDCLGIPQDQRANFKNDAITAAEHGHLGTHDGRVTYFEVTLPRLVLKYKGTAAGMGTSTAQPSIPGTSASPVTSASTKASS